MIGMDRLSNSSLVDLGAQVQRLLRDKLERDLGRPLEKGGGGHRPSSASGQAQAALVVKGNVVPQDPDQVRFRVMLICRWTCRAWWCSHALWSYGVEMFEFCLTSLPSPYDDSR